MNLCVQFHQSNPHNTQQRGMNSEKNYCCVEFLYCNSALGAGECPRAATTTGDDEQSQ